MATLRAVQRFDPAHGLHQLRQRTGDEAVHPRPHDLGHGPQGRATTGVPQARASSMTRPNGSGQSMGNSNARAPPRNADLSASPISPMNSISGWSSSGATTRSKYS